ncbi:MAG: DMT family transporter [Actinomycetota bacterium]|nr:DMT family transporter [Actinomycetota bacterium]
MSRHVLLGLELLMGALLGALSAMSVGGSEMFGRKGSLVVGVLAVGAVSQGMAAMTALVLAVLLSGEVLGPDLARGALSGVGFGVGMVTYLGGVLRSSSTVVSPLVATLTVVIPFSVAISGGEEASILAVAGVGVAIVGLVIITLGGRATAGIRQGIVWGLTSGLGYGCGLAVLIDTSSASGPWPAVTQRLVAFLLTLLLAVGSRSRPFPPKGNRWPPLLSGAFGGLASALYVLGVQADALPAAVTGAMFPAVSVALGRIVFGDVVRPPQLLGLGFVLAGVAGVVGG